MKFSAIVGLCLGLSLAWAGAASAQVYECVRPDGKVVCTIKNTTGDPSVSCNGECADCNLVCVARERYSIEDGKVPVTPPPVQGRRVKTSPGAKETPEYCQKQLNACTAGCKKNPLNKSSYDVNACISSCQDTYSGCGMNPAQ
jgi:hypothetical protein